MTRGTAEIYRRPFFDTGDTLFRRCLSINGILGLALVIVILFTPMREKLITHVDQLPTRFAKLILEPPPAPPADMVSQAASPKAIPGNPPGGGGGGGGDQGAKPEIHHAEPPAPVAARPNAVALAPSAGMAGRARAQTEVRTTLARTTRSLQSSLAGLSSSLGSLSADAPVTRHTGRVRALGSARGAAQMSNVSAGISGGGHADLGGSAISGSMVSIGDLSPDLSSGHSSGSGGGSGGGTGTGSGDGYGPGSGGGMGGGSGGGVGTGSGGGVGPGSGGGGRRGAYAPGVYRSNASLLAVIQRYAAGIQYCYSNELKHDPALRGKLVVAITVAANGDVIEANVLQNTVGSDKLASCALSQIREWKFPPIPEGVTAFNAPFVFTPPN